MTMRKSNKQQLKKGMRSTPWQNTGYCTCLSANVCIWQCCQVLSKLFGQSSQKVWPISEKVLPLLKLFSRQLFKIKCSLNFNNCVNFFSLWSNFSARKVLPRVGNTDRKAGSPAEPTCCLFLRKRLTNVFVSILLFSLWLRAFPEILQRDTVFAMAVFSVNSSGM